MKLLAIDTALEACSVAVLADGAGPVIVSEVIGRGHAERLFGMVEAAMRDAGLGFSDLDRIAVTIGPGSFTGLRVGIAAARGFALVTKCALAGVGTLAAHAFSARETAGPVSVLAVLDARRDEIYGQRFLADGTSDGEASAASADHFAARLQPGDCLAGSGADLVAAKAGRQVAIAHRLSAPDIRAVAALGRAATPDAAPPRPLYLRPPDAKPQAAKAVARR
jgi:tRNA threonylcarbamoyl adenosine modification protein YeaZ